MPNPKRRWSKSRTRTQRKSRRIYIPHLIRCSNPNCDNYVLPHHVCEKCGYYGGKQAILIKEK